jgi:hypothetical protein
MESVFSREERARQHLLDYVNDNPGSTPASIREALGMGRSLTIGRLYDMVLLGDLRREKKSKTYRYWAARKRTLRNTEALLAKLKARHNDEEVNKTPRKPNSFRNNDPNRMPIQNQGGAQGMIGHGPRGGSSLGDV